MTLPHAADYGSIVFRGARENNLKNVSLDIPKRQITVFTGVSGSGKSSLVFSTIAAESQRLINETYPAFVQQFMPHYGQPDADLLENISAAIIVDQQRLGGNSRSTVATVTDTAQMLRVLFSRAATPRLPAPGYYSTNDPRGMCAACEGIGQVAAMDMAAVVDESKSLNEGAILCRGYEVGSWWGWGVYARGGMFDPDKPIRDFSPGGAVQLLRPRRRPQGQGQPDQHHLPGPRAAAEELTGRQRPGGPATAPANRIRAHLHPQGLPHLPGRAAQGRGAGEPRRRPQHC